MQIINLVWTVVIFGIIITFGLYMFSTMQDLQTENSTEYNASGEVVSGFLMFPNLYLVIVLITVIIIIVGLLFMLRPKRIF